MSSRNFSFVPIKEGEAIIFYLNTGGFPLTHDSWSQMWQFAKELQPNAFQKLNSIRENSVDLKNFPVPTPPYYILTNKQISNEEKLGKIQIFMDTLQYNHTGFQFFEIRKDRPLIGLAEVARKIIEDSLPIKCLEAIVLGIYLINEISYPNMSFTNNLEKFTIGFKSVSNGNIHRHVVLGVYDQSAGMYGALGMSRRSSLGSKQLKYKTLTHLLLDYIESYASFLHKVKRIKIGMPLAYSNRSFESIKWNGCTITPNKDDLNDWQRLVEKHSRSIRQAYVVKQNSSFLSLRSLSNVGNNVGKMQKSNSYLNIHMHEVIKKRDAEDAEEMKQIIQNDLNKYGSTAKNEQEFYLPRTAPVYTGSTSQNNYSSNNESKKSTFIKNIRKSETLSFNNFSNNLVKRKKVSLKI